MLKYFNQLCLILVTTLLAVSISCNAKYPTVKVILPGNYQGWFAVVYNCKCGASSKVVQNDTIVQIIPQNGVLLVDYSPFLSDLDVEYYRSVEGDTSALYMVHSLRRYRHDSVQIEKLATYYGKPSFNSPSICNCKNGEFYRHQIIYHKLFNPSDSMGGTMDPEFNNHLREVLEEKK